MAFGVRFGTPWSTGTSRSADVPNLFPVAIGGRPYLIDLSKYGRKTLPAQRQVVDTSTEPGEQTLSPEGLWPRSQSDWSAGAGQEFFDEAESDRRRFWRSKGIDVWDRHRARLLKDTTLAYATAATDMELVAVGGYLYLRDGTTVRVSTNGTTFSALTATGARSVTSDGNAVYIATGTSIQKAALGATTTAALGTYAAQLVAYANGRLFAANGNEVVEIASSGASTVVFAHPVSAFVWDTIVGAPHGVYLIGHTGDRAEVFFVDVDGATGGLSPAVFAGSVPDGETINAAAFYGGPLLLATSRGMRVAATSTDGPIQHGAVIEVEGGISCLEPEGEYVWFGWSNYDGASTGLGRVNLGEFAADLVPTYASDLMAAGQGDVTSVATFLGRRWFTVAGSGLYAEDASRLVESGTLETGVIRFGTIVGKILHSVDLRHEPLVGSVSAAVSADGGDQVSVGASETAGSLRPTQRLSARQVAAETASVTVTLNRSATDTSAGPVLRMWGLRALPVPDRTEIILAPLIVKSRVAAGQDEGTPVAVDTLAEFQALKAMESAGRVVTYQEGNVPYLVVVDTVEVQPDDWSEGRGFFDGTLLATLKTVR